MNKFMRYNSIASLIIFIANKVKQADVTRSGCEC